MSNKFTLFIILNVWLFIFNFAKAQTPNWLWANAAGGVGSKQGNSTCTDASGNVYVTGTFQSTSVTFGAFTLTSASGGDMFIVKYDALGNVLWAKNPVSTSGSSGKKTPIP